MRTAMVDASGTLALCDEHGRDCHDSSAELKRRGYSREAMIAVEAFANRIDEVTGAAVWIDDPDCHDLPRELLASGGVPAREAADDAARQLRDASNATIVAALQRDPRAVLRSSGLAREGLDRELEQHRRALIARGVAAARIGPRKCFGVAFAGRGE